MEGEKMKQDIARSTALEIMMEFAGLTGLSGAGKTPRRYLWTDAFAVCNFLGFYNQTGDEKYKDLALRLVDQVHNVLGRHREDDERTGWISGLSEQEGKMHPVKGGLRIGKVMNERKPSEPFSEHLEWDRDGQYYHYLTKWMHALDRVSRVTGDQIYNTWAIELAKTAHAGFTYVPPSGGRKRMYWKMSIDLSYPLVRSMGHYDPLDGFITYNQLRAAANKDPERSGRPELTKEISDMADICEGQSWVTDDPLGIGDLLCNAFKAAQLIAGGSLEQTSLLETLLDSALPGLESFMRENHMKLPASYRLAFRELGLSIGFHAVEKMRGTIGQNPAPFKKRDYLHSRIESLMRYAPLGETIEAFWLERVNRETDAWTSHRDINMVMLATSLAPEGYLGI
jgi:hypothetical protein